jgi:hypothetical protein
MFHTKNEMYATQLEVVTMSSIDWWSTYGFKTLELAKLAEKYYLNQQVVILLRKNLEYLLLYLKCKCERA